MVRSNSNWACIADHAAGKPDTTVLMGIPRAAHKGWQEDGSVGKVLAMQMGGTEFWPPESIVAIYKPCLHENS